MMIIVSLISASHPLSLSARHFYSYPLITITMDIDIPNDSSTGVVWITVLG